MYHVSSKNSVSVFNFDFIFVKFHGFDFEFLSFAETACEITLEGDFVSSNSVYTSRGFTKLLQQGR